MEGERILFQSGFDWKTKIIALTNQAIIVGNESEGVVGIFPYEESQARQEGRTLIVNFTNERGQYEEIRYRMGEEDVVRELQRHIYQLRGQRSSELAQAQAEGKDETADKTRYNPRSLPSTTRNGEELSIGDRVKFWEEQDKINQELIPRVIRQSELLAKHVAEHDNLPHVASNAVSQALAGAREEQRQYYVTALETAKTELGEQTQSAIQKAFDDMQTALSDAKGELAEQTQASLSQAAEQLQAAQTTHKTELNEQTQAGLDQALATLREESRKTRNLLIGIAAGSSAIATVAIIVAVLT